MDPEKSILPAEPTVDPEPDGEVQQVNEKLSANLKISSFTAYPDVYSYCTFLCFFSFLTSVGILVNLFLTLIAH